MNKQGTTHTLILTEYCYCQFSFSKGHKAFKAKQFRQSVDLLSETINRLSANVRRSAQLGGSNQTLKSKIFLRCAMVYYLSARLLEGDCREMSVEVARKHLRRIWRSQRSAHLIFSKSEYPAILQEAELRIVTHRDFNPRRSKPLSFRDYRDVDRLTLKFYIKQDRQIVVNNLRSKTLPALGAGRKGRYVRKVVRGLYVRMKSEKASSIGLRRSLRRSIAYITKIGSGDSLIRSLRDIDLCLAGLKNKNIKTESARLNSYLRLYYDGVLKERDVIHRLAVLVRSIDRGLLAEQLVG